MNKITFAALLIIAGCSKVERTVPTPPEPTPIVTPAAAPTATPLVPPYHPPVDSPVEVPISESVKHLIDNPPQPIKPKFEKFEANVLKTDPVIDIPSSDQQPSPMWKTSEPESP